MSYFSSCSPKYLNFATVCHIEGIFLHSFSVGLYFIYMGFFSSCRLTWTKLGRFKLLSIFWTQRNWWTRSLCSKANNSMIDMYLIFRISETHITKPIVLNLLPNNWANQGMICKYCLEIRNSCSKKYLPIICTKQEWAAEWTENPGQTKGSAGVEQPRDAYIHDGFGLWTENGSLPVSQTLLVNNKFQMLNTIVLVKIHSPPICTVFLPGMGFYFITSFHSWK